MNRAKDIITAESEKDIEEARQISDRNQLNLQQLIMIFDECLKVAAVTKLDCIKKSSIPILQTRINELANNICFCIPHDTQKG